VNITKSAPTASVSQTNVSCNGGSNGSITVSSPSGGSGSGYTYSRDGVNYQSSGTFSNLTAGSYNIYIKDGAGCVRLITSITITQPSLQTVTVTITQQPNCDNSGVIEVTSSGGVFNKTYVVYVDNTSPYNSCGGTVVTTFNNVTSSSPTKQITGLSSDFAYCAIVTDANGCVTNSNLVVMDTCLPSTSCSEYVIDPSLAELEASDDGFIYLNYRNCDGNLDTLSFNAADYACIEDLSAFTLYYLDSGNITVCTSSTITNTFVSCGGSGPAT
jgi:hypothetical protein